MAKVVKMILQHSCKVWLNINLICWEQILKNKISWLLTISGVEGLI
jgi:hypothetical protein